MMSPAPFAREGVDRRAQRFDLAHFRARAAGLRAAHGGCGGKNKAVGLLGEKPLSRGF